MRQKFNKLFSSIPDSILNFITILSAAIGIGFPLINCIVDIIAFFRKSEEKFEVEAFAQSLNGVLILILIGILMLSVILFNKVTKYWKVQKETRDVMSSTYYRTLHDYRNYIGLERTESENGHIETKLARERIGTLLKDELDGLCDLFKALTRYEVSACIKIIDSTNDNSGTIDYENATVSTFVRSTKSDPDRSKHDKTNKSAPISKNTDFKAIVRDELGNGKSVFYQQNLFALKKEMEKRGDHYENTNIDWENYYHSTIVAPIRIHNDRSIRQKGANSYRIIGFLCVDSMSTNAFVKGQEMYYSKIVRGYAALIYTILDDYFKIVRINNNSQRKTTTERKRK